MTAMSRLIAISGGIGTGKSIVSRILRVNGYEVYDCDTEARHIMDNDRSIQLRLMEEIHPMAVSHGIIDRKLIADVVFNDNTKLEKLNAITHSAVIEDITHRVTHTQHPHGLFFIESAILYQSNLDLIVDEVWEVSAPVNIRIERVINRNSCNRKAVTARIESQESVILSRRHQNIHHIVNDGISPVLPRIMELLEKL